MIIIFLHVDIILKNVKQFKVTTKMTKQTNEQAYLPSAEWNEDRWEMH